MRDNLKIIGNIFCLLVSLSVWLSVISSCSLRNEYEEKSFDITDNFSAVMIECDVETVNILPSSDGKCRVDCVERKLDHSVSVSGSILTIKTIDERNWLDRIIGVGNKNAISLYLPESIYSSLSIISDTGDIFVASNLRFEQIDICLDTGDVLCESSAQNAISIETSTGDISLNNAECNSLDLKVSTGSINVRDTSIIGNANITVSTGDADFRNFSCEDFVSKGTTGDASFVNVDISNSFNIKRSTGKVTVNKGKCDSAFIETNTGEIELSDFSCTGALITTVTTGDMTLSGIFCDTFKSSGDTGDITLTSIIVDGKMEIERTTGDVTFYDCDGGEIAITTGTGNVKGSLCSEKIIFAQTDTGRVDIPKSDFGGRCEIRTSTGNIVITVAE